MSLSELENRDTFYGLVAQVPQSVKIRNYHFPGEGMVMKRSVETQMKRRERRGSRTFFLLSLLLCGWLQFASAQSISVGPSISGETATPIPGVGHDYINLLNETVDPSSGTVNIHIVIPMPKSRGITLPFSINYSSTAAFQLNPVGNQLELISFCNSGFYGSPCGWNFGVLLPERFRLARPFPHPFHLSARDH